MTASLGFYRDVLGPAARDGHADPVGSRLDRVPARWRVKVELVEPADDTTGVARFLESKGEGFHHVCFEVPDLAEALTRLAIDGVELIDSAPRKGARRPGRIPPSEELPRRARRAHRGAGRPVVDRARLPHLRVEAWVCASLLTRRGRPSQAPARRGRRGASSADRANDTRSAGHLADPRLLVAREVSVLLLEEVDPAAREMIERSCSGSLATASIQERSIRSTVRSPMSHASFELGPRVEEVAGLIGVGQRPRPPRRRGPARSDRARRRRPDAHRTVRDRRTAIQSSTEIASRYRARPRR